MLFPAQSVGRVDLASHGLKSISAEHICKAWRLSHANLAALEAPGAGAAPLEVRALH